MDGEILDSTVKLFNSLITKKSYDFVYRDCSEIDPLSKDNVEQQIQELLKRYCFLYDNAKIIVFYYMLSTDCKADFFTEKAKINKNILLSANESLNIEKFVDFLTILEQAALGYEELETTSFYTMINYLKSTNLFENLLKNEDTSIIEKRCGDNDFYFELVLRMISSFIDVQNINTNIEDPHYNYLHSISVLPTVKREAMYRYYEIFNFINDPEKERDYNHIFFYLNHAKRTLVGYNEFIGAFSSGYNNRSFITRNDNGPSMSQIREIYFKYHDELPYDLEIECCDDGMVTRPNNTKSCGKKFKVQEKDIFYQDGSFYHLCSNCGFIVKIDNSLLNAAIQERIFSRCNQDKLLFRKQSILSELTSLDKDYKILIKDKGC